jgi:hypothetical protein
VVYGLKADPIFDWKHLARCLKGIVAAFRVGNAKLMGLFAASTRRKTVTSVLQFFKTQNEVQGRGAIDAQVEKCSVALRK